jgi:hypothetical protein
LIHGLIELQCIHDLHDKIVKLAPTEGQCSLGIFKDKYAEEMNFPTLFYGDPCDDDIIECFSYQKIVKWELLQASGDFSCHITNLFFKTMQTIIAKVMSCFWVQIRKAQLRGRNILAKEVNYKANLEKLLKSNIGYIDFKNICISSDHLQQIKKTLFAMIWKLGRPTFFCYIYK